MSTGSAKVSEGLICVLVRNLEICWFLEDGEFQLFCFTSTSTAKVLLLSCSCPSFDLFRNVGQGVSMVISMSNFLPHIYCTFVKRFVRILWGFQKIVWKA